MLNSSIRHFVFSTNVFLTNVPLLLTLFFNRLNQNLLFTVQNKLIELIKLIINIIAIMDNANA